MSKIKSFVILLLFSISFFSLIANSYNPKNDDISGVWKGTRYQFNHQKSSYSAQFSYEFHLKQEGNQVSGYSLIKNEHGSFAKMNLRGFIDGNIFHFEEYEIVDASRTEGFAWCLKKGTLEITQEGDFKVISGKTPSFIEVYGLECTGGYTYISRENREQPSVENVDALLQKESQKDIVVKAYPNPFVLQTTISFNVNETAPVSVDVVDLNGKSTRIMKEQIVEPGNYKVAFVPENATTTAYYIVKVHIGNQTYTQNIQKFEGLLDK
jgi:hypothetical protein